MGSSTSHNHLIIGNHSMIGAALFSRLFSQNNLVYGTTHKNISIENCFYLNLLDSPTDWFIPNVSFDVVYLCAGISELLICEENPIMTQKINVSAMIELIRRLSDNGIFIVYLSSNHVFSGTKPFVTENTSCNPVNEYGRQKATVEQFIKSYCCEWAIVRLTKVIGPDMILIKNWTNKLIQHQPIEAFQDMMLSPVTLKQVVDTLIKIGQTKQTGYFQLSGAKDISYEDFAKYLAKYLQRPSSLVHSVIASAKGIKRIFLPAFTTLDCSSTIALCGEKPLDLVNQEFFNA